MLLDDPISTSIRNCDGIAVLAVCGEIDMASAPAFKSAIAEVLAGDPQGLVLDLVNVEFLSSVGVRVVMEARDRIGDDYRLAVAADGSGVGRILQLYYLDDLLSVHETVEDALNWVTAG